MSICTGNTTSHYPDFDRHQRVVRTQGEMKGGEEKRGGVRKGFEKKGERGGDMRNKGVETLGREMRK